VHQDIFGRAGWSAQSFADLFQLTTTFGHGLFTSHDLYGFYVAQGVMDTGELLTFGVREKSRHTGHGGRLMDSLITFCRTQNIGSLFLEVRATNLVAQAFYLKRGFSITGRRVGYYSSSEEGSLDALTMGRTL
jgi:ribosomal-protein-alanine N-acetyltransferase